MPMPALNIIAIHEMVRNSGRSSSRPSGIRPYLLAASQITYTTNADARSTNSQPRLPVIQPSAELLAVPSPRGGREASDDETQRHGRGDGEQDPVHGPMP